MLSSTSECWYSLPQDFLTGTTSVRFDPHMGPKRYVQDISWFQASTSSSNYLGIADSLCKGKLSARSSYASETCAWCCPCTLDMMGTQFAAASRLRYLIDIWLSKATASTAQSHSTQAGKAEGLRLLSTRA